MGWTKINEENNEKEEKFDENISKVLNFMRKRYSNLSKTKEKRNFNEDANKTNLKYQLGDGAGFL